MKKKILIVLLCISACVASVLGFTACNLFDNSGDGGEHTHTLTHYDERAATCQTEGSKEYWYCNSCGEYFSDGNAENKVTVASLKLQKTGHTEVVDAAVPKTCTTSGKTEGKHCSVCNTVIVAQQTVPAGHIEVIIDAIPKTCTYAGSTQGRKCSVCGVVTLAPQVIPAGHTLAVDEGKAATCTEEGLTDGKHCTECSYVEAQTVIPASGHSEVTDDAVEVTCTTDGKTAGKHCGVCSAVLEAQTTIPASGHREVTDDAEEPTCTTQGLTEGKHCTVCGEKTVRQQFIPAKGHREVVLPAVAATCSVEGKTAGKICSVCDTVIVAQTTVSKLSHTGSGNLCSTCGELLVEASDGLDFREITAMPYSARSVRRVSGGRSLDIIGLEVTGRGTFTGNNLIIPSMHDGLPVLGIADEAFKEDGSIIRLTIPNGVRYIGYEAFAYCRHINWVDIADSVETIGFSAFRGDNRDYLMATSFSCPENLREVTSKMLASAIHLEWIYIPKSVTKVDLSAFTDCLALTDIYFGGTQAQWESVKESWADGVSPVVHFYSATTPTGAGNFWHYDTDGVTPVRW